MATRLWKNLSNVPASECAELAEEYDALCHVKQGHEAADVVYIYLILGGVIEVRPATGVRLTGEALEVLCGNDVVARYPRERVVEASHQLVEPPPFG